MIKKLKTIPDFRPTFEKDFEVFGSQINVQIEYVGPMPVEGKAREPECFFFEIYKHGERVDSGLLDWDSHNGPLTVAEAAKAVVLQWDHLG